MGWKDTVWEQRTRERIQNQQDVGKVLDWAEKAWDFGAGISQGLKIKNPMDMSGQYKSFKKSLYY